MKHHVYVTIDKNEFYKWIKVNDIEVKDVAEIEGVNVNSIYAHLKQNRLPTTLLGKIFEFYNIIDISIVELTFITDPSNNILRNFHVDIHDGAIYGDMLTAIRTYMTYKYDEIRMRKEFAVSYGCFLPATEKKPELSKFTKETYYSVIEQIRQKISETQNELDVLNAKLTYLQAIEKVLPIEKLEIEIKNMKLEVGK